MITAKFDPQQFFQRADAVALLVSASEVFGFLKRSMELPSAWAALVARQSGEHEVVPSGGKILADGAEQVLFARTTPIELEIKEEQVPTRDGYQCRAQVRLRIRPMPEQSELVSFQRSVLGSHRVVTAAALAKYLQPAVREALVQFSTPCDAADLVGPGRADAACAAVVSAVLPLCFSGGLALEGPAAVRFESPAFSEVLKVKEESVRRRHEHEAGRQVRDAIKSAQAEHLGHLSSLLTKLSELARTSPDVGLPDLIRTFSERQRGELYEALFASETPGAKTRWLVVAVGEEMLFFDPQNLSAPQRRLAVAGFVGPVRSVQSTRNENGGTVLWLGASTGIYRLPIERAEPDLILHVDAAPSVRGGFNAVAVVGNRVIASHSELGLYEWTLGAEPQALACANARQLGRPRFESMTRGAKAVRCVTAFEGRVYCAIDDRIISWADDETDADRPAHIYAGSRSTITALCASPLGLFAGNSDGDVLYWTKGRDSEPQRLSVGAQRAAESVWYLSTHGVNRVIYTDTSIQVHARVPGDSFACRYEAGGQTLRRVNVAADLFVATTELRDRLICWHPGRPARPSATIGVAAMCGRSIQDVCLVAESDRRHAAT